MSRGKGIVISKPTPTASVPGRIIVSHLDNPEDPNATIGATLEVVNHSAFLTLELGDIVEVMFSLNNFCEILQFVAKSTPARGRVTVRPQEGHVDGKVAIVRDPIPNPFNVQSVRDESRFLYNPLYQLWPGDIVDCIPTSQAFCIITKVIEHAEQGG
jgi:hypothetical protein